MLARKRVNAITTFKVEHHAFDHSSRKAKAAIARNLTGISRKKRIPPDPSLPSSWNLSADPGPSINLLAGGNKPSADPWQMPRVGTVIETSWRLNGADFEWRIEGFRTGDLRREGLRCPPFAFAGWEWLFFFESNYMSSSVLLELCHWEGADGTDPAPVVRYWLGIKRLDGGRMVQERIGSGRAEPGLLVVLPWLRFSEMERRIEDVAPSGILTFIAKLRTGPETDDEMKNLIAIEPVLSVDAKVEKSTQTDKKDFSNAERRYYFVPVETEDILNIMARQNTA